MSPKEHERCTSQLASLPDTDPKYPGRQWSMRCKLKTGHAGPHHDWSSTDGIRWSDAGRIVERRGVFKNMTVWDLPEEVS